nr:NUDIX domain-containing protein [Priestia taiwanensis]
MLHGVLALRKVFARGGVGVRRNIRAAGIAIHDGHVLLHKMDDFWILPGGDVAAQETTLAGLKREFQEELGIEVQMKQLLWIVENFFEYNNQPISGVEFHYLIEVPESITLQKQTIFDGYEQETNATLHFAWHKVSELNSITLLPAVLVGKLMSLPMSLPKTIEHIINNKIVTSL